MTPRLPAHRVTTAHMGAWALYPDTITGHNVEHLASCAEWWIVDTKPGEQVPPAGQ